MKLKKGSKEAAAFMAKLRASRGKKKTVKKLSGVKTKPVYVTILGQRVKVGTKLHTKLVAQKKHFDDLLKSELSGTKKKAVKRSKPKKVHTDVKSHNYKISISGAENAIKQKAKELYDNNMNLYGHWCAALLVAKTKTDKNIIKKRLSEIKSNINHYKKFIK